MAENIKQIFDANASSTLPDTALLYSGLSPFGPTDDTAITVGSFKTQLNGYYLQKSNNLSDVANAATARTNLDVPQTNGTGATGTWNIDISGSSDTCNIANLADNVSLTADSSNATFYPVFAPSSSSGAQACYINSSFNFNPSTGVLTAPSFSGDISGTAAIVDQYVQTKTAGGSQLIFQAYRTTSSSYLTFGSMTAGTTPTLAFSKPLDGAFTISGATQTACSLDNTNLIDGGAIQSGVVSSIVGGTGVNNSGRTITVGGNINFANSFTTSGSFAVTQTYTNTTNVTFPTSGTLATTAQIPTGAALTKTDDTNVTLTLGGSASTALVNAASITAGWTGTLGTSRGGLGGSTTPTTGTILTGNGSAWIATTATYPSTTTVNQILYSSSANTVAGLTTANNGVLITSAGGVPSISSTLPTAVQDNITNLGTIGENLNVSFSSSGSTNTITITNSSNTASSNSTLRATVGGTSSGDPSYALIINGGSAFSGGIDNSDNDSFKEQFDTAIGTSSTRIVTTSGEQTMPLQPAFSAYKSSNTNNVTGAGTAYTIICNTEIYDQNSDYNNSTGVFTAPVTGRYLFCLGAGVFGLTSLMTSGSLDLVTSNRTYRSSEGNYYAASNATASYELHFSVQADMDAGDTASMLLTISNGAGDTADLDGGSVPTRTFFQGFLMC